MKFCGCTSVADARAAVELGVDAIGVIFAPASPRRVSIRTALEIAQTVPVFVSLIGVFVEPTASDVEQARNVGYIAQFSGRESAAFCESQALGPYIKVHHVAPETASAAAEAPAFAAALADYQRATWMFDTSVEGKSGGTGRTFPWTFARELAGDRPLIVSGGLTAENVGACIRSIRPFAVDVRSGIETDGVKDRSKMRAFVRAVREADAEA